MTPWHAIVVHADEKKAAGYALTASNAPLLTPLSGAAPMHG
jgi:hypothetical protein